MGAACGGCCEDRELRVKSGEAEAPVKVLKAKKAGK